MRSIAELQEAVSQPADRDVALFELGMALDRRGQSTAGIAAVREAAGLKPDEPYYQLGLAWLLAHRSAAFEEAVESGRRAFALEPTLWKAAGLLGWLLGVVLERPAEARPFAARAVELNPEPRPLYAHFCRTFLHVEQLDRLRLVIEAEAPPGSRMDLLHDGLAAALMQVGRYDEALRLLQELVHAAPDNALLLTTLADAESAFGDYESAARHLERALVLSPSSDYVRSSYFATWWRSGDHDRIGAAIAALASPTPRPSTPTDTERGLAPVYEAIHGETVLVTETPNGYGDTIQLARVAPMLQARGARAILECREPLRPLLETVHGTPDVVVPYDSYPPYDRAVTPFWLPPGWTWEELSRVPYFEVSQAVRQPWAERVRAVGDGLHVGLAWRVSNELPNRDDPFRRRCIPLRQLAPLITLAGTTWHSLTVGEPASREIVEMRTTLPFNDLSTQLTDFLQTAAVVCALDVVVTVDTAVAHLAGALAKPTFLMLPYFADWRWGHDETILGYPTVRPFRQTSPGDWAPVIADVREALRAGLFGPQR